MITIDDKCITIPVPLFERCKKDSCNIYNMILQHRASKCITVFKVRSVTTKTDIRLWIKLVMPDDMEQGEYTYYLVSEDEWKNSEIDRNYVLYSYRKTDKEAFTVGGKIIVANNGIVVQKWKNARLIDATGDIIAKGKYLSAKAESEDAKAVGKIYEPMMGMLATGVLKYGIDDIMCCDDELIYSDNAQDEYTIYNG